MIEKKRGQSGIEYMIIVGFLTFAVTTILISAYFYIGMSRDKIRMNQLQVFSEKIVSSAESVFYSGEPSQTTIMVYIPENVDEINIKNEGLMVKASTSSGDIKRFFDSDVPLNGTLKGEGSQKITIKARPDFAEIIQK